MVQLVFIVILTTIAISLCERQYGCDTTGKNNFLAVESGDYYGDIVDPMVFAGKKEFRRFLKELESLRAEILAEKNYNDMDYVLNWNNQFHNSGKTLDKFLYDYIPGDEPRQDSLGLTMEFFDRISTYHPWTGVKDHFYFAVADLNVPLKIVKNFRNKGSELPPKSVYKRHIVGVIKFIYLDRYGREEEGCVIIDMEYNLILDVLKINQNNKIFSLGENRSYMFIGKHRSYIEVIHSHHNYDMGKIDFTIRDIIYIERPNCSFITVANQAFLSTPIRSIVKFVPLSYPKAFILAELLGKQESVFGNTLCVGYVTEYMNNNIPVIATFSSVDEMAARDVQIFNQVCTILNMEFSDGIAKLREIENNLTSNKKIYRQSVKDEMPNPVIRWILRAIKRFIDQNELQNVRSNSFLGRISQTRMPWIYGVQDSDH